MQYKDFVQNTLPCIGGKWALRKFKRVGRVGVLRWFSIACAWSLYTEGRYCLCYLCIVFNFILYDFMTVFQLRGHALIARDVKVYIQYGFM